MPRIVLLVIDKIERMTHSMPWCLKMCTYCLCMRITLCSDRSAVLPSLNLDAYWVTRVFSNPVFYKVEWDEKIRFACKVWIGKVGDTKCVHLFISRMFSKLAWGSKDEVHSLHAGAGKSLYDPHILHRPPALDPNNWVAHCKKPPTPSTAKEYP